MYGFKTFVSSVSPLAAYWRKTFVIGFAVRPSDYMLLYGRTAKARGMGLEKHLKHMLEKHTSTDLDQLAILLWNSDLYDKLRLGGLLRNISLEIVRDRNLKK